MAARADSVALFPSPAKAVLDSLVTPCMLVCREQVADNIRAMVQVAGDVARLRPHCKTHKMPAVIEMLLSAGITRHKSATVAETEMLADCGVRDVVLAYPAVGPTAHRVIALLQRFPDLAITVTADDIRQVDRLNQTAIEAQVTIGVMADINPGLDRTGVRPDDSAAAELVEKISQSSNLRQAGLHVYDGNNRYSDVSERREAVRQVWREVSALRSRLAEKEIELPEILCGGTPTFPVWAEISDPAVTLSPGTCILHDQGYGSRFPDLPFVAAAAVATRVISRPSSDRLTLDLGNKAVAADPLREDRVVFPQLPDAAIVLHNEEHLVVETESAGSFAVGDVLLGIPGHVCPTSNLHESVVVLSDGIVQDQWNVTARRRILTV